VTIRRRLLLLLLPALAVLMLAGGLADGWIASATTRQAYDQALASAAIAAAAYVQVEHGAVRFGSSSQVVDFLRAEGTQARGGDSEDSRFYAVTGPDGRLLAGMAGLARLGAPGAAAAPAPATATTPAAVSVDAAPRAQAASAADVARPVFADADLLGHRVRLVSLRVATSAGPATVMVAETRARREQTQRVMLFGKLMVDFAELDVTLLLIWTAVYFGLRPLAWLREEVEAHSRHELQRFDERRVPTELRPVVVAFNRLLELLRDAASAQRRFVANAAHQMRTPVAGLLAQIELLKSDPHARPFAAELGKLQHGAQSLAHASNQLLALARAEPAAALDSRFRPVALDALVHRLLEQYLERADQAGIDLGVETRAVGAAGDAWLLEDLLGNLIDNALKYTPRGGHVTLRCGLEGEQPFLEVEDDGPGIPEGERARVRERFYRRPGSPGFGAGLGLAIVEEIARAHHASFIIGSGADERGARMRVRFRSACAAHERHAPPAGEPEPLLCDEPHNITATPVTRVAN